MPKPSAETAMKIADHLEQLFAASDSSDERVFLQSFGTFLHRAIAGSALYLLPRNIQYLGQFGAPDGRTAFVKSLNQNTQAVFNVGDPGPEDVLITLADADFEADDTPAVSAELMVMWMRTPEEVTGFPISLNRGEDGALRVAYLPRIVIIGEGVGLAKWQLAQPEEMDRETSMSILATLLGTITYLDQQLAAEGVTGAYGDGVQNATILDPNTLLMGGPAWLRAAA